MECPRSIQGIVRRKLCISCGACVSAAPRGSMRMVLNERKGIFVPEILDPAAVSGTGPEYEVCPGKGAPIVQMGRTLYGDADHYRMEIGWYREIVACHSNNPRILEHASSGGVMTDVAHYLMETGYVDGVTVAKFLYGGKGPRAASYIARDLDGLLEAQGSKYCPTATNELVAECVRSGQRYLFLGTPCQVLALRLAMEQQPGLHQTFPLVMANLCGGYRDFRDLDNLLEQNGFEGPEVTYFRFRGGGQPGSLLARDSRGRTLCLPYPGYNIYRSYARPRRCIFCVDGFGLLADFACGDAWIDRFTNKDGLPWSLLVMRTPQTCDILRQMVGAGRLTLEPVTEPEVLYSQRFNMDSKIVRQRRRRALCRLLGMALPSWDMLLPPGGSWRREIRILLGKTKRRCLHEVRQRLTRRRRLRQLT